MAPQAGDGGWRDLRNGAVLQCIEAATLGLPFEVWKTRMGRMRNEGNFTAAANIIKGSHNPCAFAYSQREV